MEWDYGWDLRKIQLIIKLFFYFSSCRVVITVVDESLGVKEEFSCDYDKLTKSMGYFSDVAAGKSEYAC